MENIIESVINFWWLGLGVVTLGLLVPFLAKKVGKSFGGEMLEITAAEAAELLAQKQAVVIDISEKRTFEKRHIPDSVNLPGIMFIDGSIDVMNFPEPIILVPMKGLIPMPVLDHFREHGAPQIYKLKGGVEAWRDAKFPVACS